MDNQIPAPRMVEAYPVQLDIDYPDRLLNRLTSFFRLIYVIPVIILLIFLIGGERLPSFHTVTIGGGGFLFLAPLLMIAFFKKYPRWWFEWNLELYRFLLRISAYLYLLTDEYPSTDQPQSVKLDIAYPQPEDLHRFMPLVKWLLAIPHYIILLFLSIAAIFVTIFAWFAILFTGRYPQKLFNFVVGVFRWTARVTSYAVILTTDKYPPFSLR